MVFVCPSAAMSVNFCIVSMVITLGLLSDTGSAVQITIEPSTIQDVETITSSTVSVLCTLNIQEEMADAIKSIKILRKTGRLLAICKENLVASYLYQDTGDVEGDVTATGKIGGTKEDIMESYLNLTLKNVVREDAGTYICQVTYTKSGSDEFLVNKAKGYLMVKNVGMKKVEKNVGEVKRVVEKTGKKIVKYGEKKNVTHSGILDLDKKINDGDEKIKIVIGDEKKMEDRFTIVDENTSGRLKKIKDLNNKNQKGVNGLREELNNVVDRTSRDRKELGEIGEQRSENNWKVKDLVVTGGRTAVGIKELQEKETKLDEKVSELEMTIRNIAKKMSEITESGTNDKSKEPVIEAKQIVHNTDLKLLEKKENALLVKMSELEDKVETAIQSYWIRVNKKIDNDDDNNVIDIVKTTPMTIPTFAVNMEDNFDSMVAFAATIQDSSPIKVEKRKTLIFSKFLFKASVNAYNEKTGIFTAHVDGLYHFELTIMVDCISCHAQWDIVVNRKRTVLSLQVGVMFDDNQGSASSVVQLRYMDEVKVVTSSTSDGLTLSTNQTCMFSGHLVTPL